MSTGEDTEFPYFIADLAGFFYISILNISLTVTTKATENTIF